MRVVDAVDTDEDVEQIGDELPINLGPIIRAELQAAVKKLKPRKACGPDGIPEEFWRIILEDCDY